MKRYAAVILAAGRSTRFGADKLRAPLSGAPLLDHAIAIARQAPVERVIVVGPDRDPASKGSVDPGVEWIEPGGPEMSDSLKAGIAAVQGYDGAFVFLGDMPHVPVDLAARLAAALGESFAAVPTHRGKPAHPVLLSARAFAAVEHLSGDVGAGPLLRGRDDVVRLEVPEVSATIDIDTPEDLARLSTVLR